jgi:hypothetical protein
MYLHESKLMKLTAQQISSFLFIHILFTFPNFRNYLRDV